MPRKPAAPPPRTRTGSGSDAQPHERVQSSTAAAPDKATRPRSLMKTSALAGRGAAASQPVPRANGGMRRASARRTATADLSTKIEERIAAASEELASG